VDKVFDIIRNVLGIIKYTPEEWFRINLSMSEDDLLQKIQARADAKKEKNFELADSIRQELKEQGVELLDTVDGTIYRAVKIRNF